MGGDVDLGALGGDGDAPDLGDAKGGKKEEKKKGGFGLGGMGGGLLKMAASAAMGGDMDLGDLGGGDDAGGEDAEGKGGKKKSSGFGGLGGGLLKMAASAAMGGDGDMDLGGLGDGDGPDLGDLAKKGASLLKGFGKKKVGRRRGCQYSVFIQNLSKLLYLAINSPYFNRNGPHPTCSPTPSRPSPQRHPMLPSRRSQQHPRLSSSHFTRTTMQRRRL